LWHSGVQCRFEVKKGEPWNRSLLKKERKNNLLRSDETEKKKRRDSCASNWI
jgi:hypothetical protein